MLPRQPGVYQFFNEKGEILYVGKAKDLKNRVTSYFANPTLLIGKTKILVSQVKKIKITVVASELESLLLEAALIKKYTPKYNIRLVDGKMYPLIRITTKMPYPAVLTARKREDAKSTYFGPYPSATAMHSVLRMLRRIFPYQSVLNHPKKICLYHHLGLCPCATYFSTVKGVTLARITPYSNNAQNDYKKNLRHIIGFLEGKSKSVIKSLEKERDVYAKKEAYEKAESIQKQLDAIAKITEPFTNPFEYVTNPNLVRDIREKEMKDLQDILKKYGVTIALPRRIECYDNSNFQGTNPTSSMVVLTNGEIDTSQYRKFLIKSVKGPNDFASMQEVLQRRLKHPEWPYPDLLIVDGGKGQVSAAKEVLSRFYSLSSLGEDQGEVDSGPDFAKATTGVQARMTKDIPLIGLAKREETIITSDLQEIHLPKSSPALQLVMRIRDEAHRFAITFHRKRRQKATFD